LAKLNTKKQQQKVTSYFIQLITIFHVESNILLTMHNLLIIQVNDMLLKEISALN